MTENPNSRDDSREDRDSIRAISVRGFKCFATESRIEIRPLTILAGANSSGKSSIMQPLLLMKQTLEATYDPGALLLNGPNVKQTAFEQLVSHPLNDRGSRTFSVSISAPRNMNYTITFARNADNMIDIPNETIAMRKRTIRLTPDRKGPDLHKDHSALISDDLPGLMQYKVPPGYQLSIRRDRCFLAFAIEPDDGDGPSYPVPCPAVLLAKELHRMIHVPGLRGNPERNYERTASGPFFAGTFERYVATIIADWQSPTDPRLKRLKDMLEDLGLTQEVSARPVNDAQIELLVGRLPETDSDGTDLVSIADVGLGVSQVLPVLVALLVAEKGQLVYIEQPELHLHPRAQYGLARIMAETAKRGVRLVVETHSALLLLRVRTLMAKGDLDPDLVKLDWFSRDPEDGTASIQSADLDENGAFGDWPEDFGDVELSAEGAYLDAVEERST